jgi:hypothetical protein
MRHALTLVLTLVLAVGSSPARAEEVQVKIRKEHPKLYLTPERINRLKQSIQENTPEWQEFKKTLDSGRADMGDYALGFAVTGDKGYAAKGVAQLRLAVKGLGSATGGGLALGRTMSPMANIGVAYDWLFSEVPEDLRKEWIDKVNANLSMMKFDGGMWANATQRHLRGFAVAALSTYPENSDAQRFVDISYSDHWMANYVPALNLNGVGGGWHEGPAYAAIVVGDLVHYADAMETATENAKVYDSVDFFKSRMPYFLLMTWPEKKDFQGARNFWPYPSFGDCERWRCPLLSLEHIAQMILIDHYAGTKEAQWALWRFRELKSNWGAPGETRNMFLWTNRRVQPEPPAIRTHWAKGTGTVFTRSDWTESATWVMFQCGDRFSYHQALDQGNFNIYKKGDLVINSGVYEPSGPTDQDGHLQAYKSRAIAHNTLIVWNPDETFPGYRSGNSPPNDGGQRTWRPAGNSPHFSQWLQNRKAVDTGDILVVEDKDALVHILADVTGAYNSTYWVSDPNKAKLREFTRELVDLRPVTPGGEDFVVVFDRVETTDPSFAKRTLIHTLNEPLVEGTGVEEARGQTLYKDARNFSTEALNGRLFVQNVLPEKLRLRKVGGRGVMEYGFNGRNYPHEITPFEDHYGAYRIETEATEPRTRELFLQVLSPRDKSQGAPPVLSRLSKNGAEGVKIEFAHGAWEVLFASEKKGDYTGDGARPPWGGGVARFTPVQGAAKTLALGGGIPVTPDGVSAVKMPPCTLGAPTLTDVQLVGKPTSEVAVALKTDKPAVARVEFGLNADCNQLTPWEKTPGTEHKLALRGLLPGKETFFRAMAKFPDGVLAYSKEFSVTSPAKDETPPEIRDVQVTEVYPTMAFAFWRTDDASTSVVEYGETGKLGSAAGNPDVTEALEVDHRVLMSNLKPETKYFVKVRSKNTDGFESVKEGLTFTTPARGPSDIVDDFSRGFDKSQWEGLVDVIEWGPKDRINGTPAIYVEPDKAGGKKPMVVLRKGEFDDFTLTVTARTTEGGGKSSRDYAVYFGAKDTANFTAAWFSPSGPDRDICGLVRFVNGKCEPVGEVYGTAPLMNDVEQKIRIVKKGKDVTVEIDGRLFAEAHNVDVPRGMIGLGSNNDGAAFDNLMVTGVVPAPNVIEVIGKKSTTPEGILFE